MRLFYILFITGLFILPVHGQVLKVQGKFTSQMKTEQQEAIKQATMHAWKGYLTHAKGFDDLRPLTLEGKNWYKHTMHMTPIDAWDSFTMMGLAKEASEAKELILSQENFNLDNDVQVFEITIRILGGLISAYEMDGDKRFLTMARDMADRLMPAFATPTGMPYRYVHLQTGKLRDSINNPAEIGTLLLEFGQLSKLTGNPKYFNAAKKAIMAVYDRRSKLNLPGERINAITGEWVSTKSHISGYIDSYFEYLYKGWLLFADKDFKNAFDVHNKAIKKHLLYATKNGTYLQHVDMHSGKALATRYGALDAFYAGLCALAGDVPTARKIQKANDYMWRKFDMEPEEFDFTKDSITSAYYILRPENIESCFYLYRLTKKDEYLWMGKRMVDDILRNCKTNDAFASIKNVLTLEKMNSMESFFFAETLKYAYLLFADDIHFNLEQQVFNTEAHPFKVKHNLK